jgi:hypothetical protein
VRDDPRARTQLALKLRPQTQVDRRREIERHHGRIGQIRLEEIALPEGHPVAHPGALRRLDAQGHQLRIDLDADAAGAEIASGRDHQPTVA